MFKLIIKKNMICIIQTFQAFFNHCKLRLTENEFHFTQTQLTDKAADGACIFRKTMSM